MQNSVGSFESCATFFFPLLQTYFNTFYITTYASIHLCFSERASTLTTFVQSLGSYESLKKQFDWLIDGEVAHLVHDNLRRELKNMELFLRLGIFPKTLYFVQKCVRLECLIIFFTSSVFLVLDLELFVLDPDPGKNGKKSDKKGFFLLLLFYRKRENTVECSTKSERSRLILLYD